MTLKIDNSLCNAQCKKCQDYLPGLPRAAKGKGQEVPEWMESCLAGSLELFKKKKCCSALYLE